MRPLNALLLVSTLLFAVGCGMEAVDTRIQARSESAVEQYPVEIVEGKYVCPHVVTTTNQPFDPKAVQQGDVEGAFGPFVPCGTIVEGGEGDCQSCGKKYRTSGQLEDPESNDPDGTGAQMALPLLRCPHCKEVFHPVAPLVKGSTDSTLGVNVCPNSECRKNVTMVARDLLTAVDIPEEILCPSCKNAIDPTMNACTEKSCKLGGIVRNVKDFEGPCWRCGGLADCPNCGGAGVGSQGIYDATPVNCWVCETNGECPECNGTGFSTYEGQLPPGFKLWTRRGQEELALPSKKRGWEHDGSGASSGGGMDEPMDDEPSDEPSEEDSGDSEEDAEDSGDSGDSGESEGEEGSGEDG